MNIRERKAMFARGFDAYSVSEHKMSRATHDIRFQTKKLKNGNDVIIVKGKNNTGKTLTRFVGQEKR